MKKILSRRILEAIVVFALFLFIAPLDVKAQAAATLALSPSTDSISIGDEFDIEIIVDTDGVDVDGVDAVIDYDNTRLSVVSVTEGTIFSTYPLNEVSSGTISLSGIDLTTPFNGTGTLGTIRFRALQEGTADVEFDFTPGSTTDSNVADSITTDDILDSVTDGSYAISSSGNDSDGDGMPDDWENTHGLDPDDPSDADEDPDGDGWTNLEEYRAGTDPNDPNSNPEDSDGDGIPDYWEDEHGLDSNSASDADDDPDGDGATNLQEYLAGTDPNDPNSYPSLPDSGIYNHFLFYITIAFYLIFFGYSLQILMNPPFKNKKKN